MANPPLTQDDNGFFFYLDDEGFRRYPYVSGPKRSELSPLADFGYRQLERVLSGILWAAVKSGILYEYIIIDMEECGACGVAPDYYTHNQWGRMMRITSFESDKALGYYYRAGQLCIGVGFAEGWIDNDEEEDEA